MVTVRFSLTSPYKVNSGTQTVKGGNTEEFYHTEVLDDDGNVIKQDAETKADDQYNTDGTINKSLMLANMHPDVAKVSWKFGRWHHEVNYNSFKKNELKMKKGIKIPKTNNEYGMTLVDDWEEGKY